MIHKLCTVLIAGLMLATARSHAAERTPQVYVIPVKEMIEPALLYVVRRGADEAARRKADALILQMDTTGGRVDAAVAIVKTLGHSEIPVYTLVEREAISAGALIAISTPNIYMMPGSVIGDITPISLGLTGGVNDLPEAEKEKMTSYVAAHVRSAAEQGGYDPELGEAMVRRDREYRVDDQLIIPAGEVLTLTNTEAARLVGEEQRPLLSKGTVSGLDELLEIIGLPDAETTVLKVSSAERLARWLARIAPILMIIGLGGIWLEFKTPGFGVFGITGVLCLLLFFFGHHIAGLSGMEDVLLFLIGAGLLAVEVFVTPGFGVMGIGGILLILISFINAMSERLPGSWRPMEFSIETFSLPLLNVSIAFVCAVVLAAFAGRFLPQTRAFRHLTLETVSPEPEEEDDLLGLEGIAHSDLRPGGTAYFGDRKIDVVTLGDYISRQTPIRIVEVHGNRIVVEDISRG